MLLVTVLKVTFLIQTPSVGLPSHPLTTGTHISEGRVAAFEEKLCQTSTGTDVARETGNRSCPCQGLVTNSAVGRKDQRHYLLEGSDSALKMVLGYTHTNKRVFSWPQTLKESCTHQ